MSLGTWKTAAEVIQSIATSSGLVAAGLWSYLLFVRRRQRFPRAELIHSVSVIELSPGDALMHVRLTLKNIGDVLIRATMARVHVGRVLPLSTEVSAKLSRGEDPVSDGESDIRWMKLGRRECDWRDEPREIEPGEEDDFHFDFVIPAGLQVVEVYSYVKNEAKPGRMIGWRHTSLVGVESARLPINDAKGDERNGDRKSIHTESP